MGMLVSLRRSGPCRGVRWDENARRYRCGLMTNALLRPLVQRWIAAGLGCDSDAVAD